MAIKQLVLQGLPDDHHANIGGSGLVDGDALFTELVAFISKRSLRSMPGPRGVAPTRSAQLAPSNASVSLSVSLISLNKGNAQSSSSMRTPSRVPTNWGTSLMIRLMGWSFAENAAVGELKKQAVGDLPGPPVPLLLWVISLMFFRSVLDM